MVACLRYGRSARLQFEMKAYVVDVGFLLIPKLSSMRHPGWHLSTPVWKRVGMRKIFKFSGKNERYVDGIIDWAAVRLRDQSRWPSSYHDEFMCLMLAKAYVQGNDDFVRDVSQRLSCLAVSPDVRALFVDESGEKVFKGTYLPS